MLLEEVQLVCVAADEHLVALGSRHRLRRSDHVTYDSLVGPLREQAVHLPLAFKEYSFVHRFPHLPVRLGRQVGFGEMDGLAFQLPEVLVEVAEP